MKRLAVTICLALALCAAAEAQTKISELPAATAATTDDLTLVVDDPGGTPATKKITVGNFAGSLFSLKTTTDLAEGTNLYFTNARADGRIAAAVGVSVQAFDADLSTFAGLSPGANSVLQFVSGSWAARTTAQLKTSLSLTASDVGLANVTNDAQTKAAVVPNTAPAAGQLLVGNAGATAYAPQSVSGDCTLTSAGAVTCTKAGGASFAASATTDATNATNITSGTLGLARLPSVPRARAYATATQSIPNATYTALTFDSEQYDTDSIHSTASNTDRLTCTTAGVYHITANVHFDVSATGGRIAAIVHNNITFVQRQVLDPSSVASFGTQFVVSADYQCAAGDYFQLQVYQTTGGALNSLASFGGASMSMFLIK